MTPSYTTTTTITAPPSGSLQNGREKVKTVPLYLEEDIRPEMKEDIHDPTYQDEEGPPPKLEYVWRNIILMVLLHLGGLYGIILVPSCKLYTCLFGEQRPLSWASASDFSLLSNKVPSDPRQWLLCSDFPSLFFWFLVGLNMNTESLCRRLGGVYLRQRSNSL